VSLSHLDLCDRPQWKRKLPILYVGRRYFRRASRVLLGDTICVDERRQPSQHVEPASCLTASHSELGAAVFVSSNGLFGLHLISGSENPVHVVAFFVSSDGRTRANTRTTAMVFWGTKAVV
jgi:hypothetical protein